MRKLALLVTIGAILVSGCGLKKPPQPVADAGPPHLASLNQELSGNVLKLRILLAGGNAVGYQIDRAEVDPYCSCPAFWQRFYEEPPQTKNAGTELQRLLRLRLDREYMFRIRAIDSLGRLGPWSKPIRAKAEERLQQ